MIQYHSQQQALEFANAIIPVPENYPLAEGIEEDFRIYFSRLCALGRDIYLDIAEHPEDYGVALLSISETDTNIIRDSYRTIHRFLDVVNALFLCGNTQNHILTVETGEFKVRVKKVSKYGLILSKLIEFGFQISNYNGKVLDSKSEVFTVESPDYPFIIDALDTYCHAWLKLNENRSGRKVKNTDSPIKLAPEEFGHHFYRFDYKITADLSKIPMSQWVSDEAVYIGLNESEKQFYMDFYKRSLDYKDLIFNGDYFFKGKRIARVYANNDKFLTLKLNRMNSYLDLLDRLPPHLAEVFNKNYCTLCGFQGGTKEACKFRLHWNRGDNPHIGCAYLCFNFGNPGIEDMDVFFQLLEKEYGIEQGKTVRNRLNC